MNTEGIQILIDPVVMPMYKLYITYKGKRPTNKEFKDLHNRLTNENSIVTKAHRMNMPVEAYLNWCKEQVFKNL